MDDGQEPASRVSRRKMVIATGASLTAIAGCTSSDSTDAESTTDASSEATDVGDGSSETATSSTAASAEAAFTIDASAPERVEAGEELTYDLAIENEGGAAGEATFGLDISSASESRWEPVFEEEIELEAGEEMTHTSDPFTFDQSMTVQWEFWMEGPTREDTASLETDVVTPTRSFGETFETPHGLSITASDPRLTTRYEYEDHSGDEAVHRASDGRQFVFVDIRVENTAGETRTTPNRLSFELVAGDEQIEPMDRTAYEAENGYDGLNEIVDGVVAEGVQPFDVSDAVSESDLALFHSEVDADTDTTWEVVWE